MINYTCTVIPAKDKTQKLSFNASVFASFLRRVGIAGAFGLAKISQLIYWWSFNGFTSNRRKLYPQMKSGLFIRKTTESKSKPCRNADNLVLTFFNQLLIDIVRINRHVPCELSRTWETLICNKSDIKRSMLLTEEKTT